MRHNVSKALTDRIEALDRLMRVLEADLLLWAEGNTFREGAYRDMSNDLYWELDRQQERLLTILDGKAR